MKQYSKYKINTLWNLLLYVISLVDGLASLKKNAVLTQMRITSTATIRSRPFAKSIGI